jgi:hypothetical protein
MWCRDIGVRDGGGYGVLVDEEVCARQYNNNNYSHRPWESLCTVKRGGHSVLDQALEIDSEVRP